jgi:hypothetical protein
MPKTNEERSRMNLERFKYAFNFFVIYLHHLFRMMLLGSKYSYSDSIFCIQIKILLFTPFPTFNTIRFAYIGGRNNLTCFESIF